MFFLSPRPYIVLWVLCVLGLLLYLKVLSFPFVHDDIVFIQLNPSIARWDDLGSVFIHPSAAVTQAQTPYYRPLLEVVYRLEHLVFGMSPWGFHLVNVLWHGLVAWLVYILLRQVRLGRRLALLGALFFLVHPLQTEAVACVSGISNLAVASFMLGVLIVHIRSRRQGKCISWLALALAAGAFFLKEQGLVLVALVGVYEFTFRREQIAARFRVLMPYVFLTGAFWMWRSFLFPGSGSGLWTGGYELTLRLLALPRIILTDIALVFWPTGLHYYRGLDILASYGQAWAVLAIVVGVLVLLFRRSKPARRRGVLFGAGFAFFTLLPGLNILPLINEYSQILVAEHFMYLPLAGIFIVVAAIGADLFRRIRWGWLVAAGVIIILSAMTLQQVLFWRSETALFERTVAFEPQLGRVRLLLARAYARERRFADAAREYTATLRIMENYVKKIPAGMPVRQLYEIYMKVAMDGRAACRLTLGDHHGALHDYAAVVSMARRGVRSSAFGGDDTLCANNMGMLLLREGDRYGAREAFQQALRFNPAFAPAMNNLGMMAFERGDKVSARFWFRQAMKAAPWFRPAADNYKKVL